MNPLCEISIGLNDLFNALSDGIFQLPYIIPQSTPDHCLSDSLGPSVGLETRREKTFSLREKKMAVAIVLCSSAKDERLRVPPLSRYRRKKQHERCVRESELQ